MPRSKCVVSAAAIAALAGSAAAQPYSFVGPEQGDWFLAANWAPEGPPPAGADVVIGPGKHAYLGVNGAPPTVGTITAGGKLTINQGVTIAGQATLTDGDIRGTGTSAVVCNPLNLTGQNSVWRSGRIIGRVEQGGFLTIGGTGGTSGTPALEGLFRNQGGVNQGARLFLYNGSTVENTGSWEQGNGLDDQPGGNGHGGVFKNLPGGTFSRTGPAFRDFSAKFESGGHVKVDEGRTTFTGVSTKIGGTVELLNGGSIRVLQSPYPGYEVSVGGSLTGRGDLILENIGLCTSGGLTSNLSSLSTLGLNIALGSAGVLQLDGGLNNDGLCTWHSGRITGPGLVRNRAGGSMIWGIGAGTGAVLATNLFNDDYVYVQGSPRIDNAVFSNNAGGTVQLERGSLSLAPASSGSFLNRGLMLKTAGPFGNTLLDVPLQMLDGGRMEIEDYGIWLMAGSEWSGECIAVLGPAATAQLQFDAGVHTVSAGFPEVQGTGTAEVRTAATLDITGGELVARMQGGASVFRVAGLLRSAVPFGFINRGVMHVSGGLDGAVENSVRNETEMTLQGCTVLGYLNNIGNLRVRGSVQLGAPDRDSTLTSGVGSMIMDGNCSISLNSAATFVKVTSGKLLKINPGQGTLIGGKFNNGGTVEVQEGTLAITGNVINIAVGFLQSGTWIVHPGASLQLPGPINAVAFNATLNGNSSSCPWMAEIGTNNGSVTINGDHTGQVPLLNCQGGTVQIDTGCTATIPGEVQNGTDEPESILDEITEVFVPTDGPEPRLVTPTLTNHARLVPGGHGEPGPFNLTGDLLMRPTGRVLVELGGLLPLEEHDRVAIFGSATLTGTLDLSLIDEFLPSVGQEFTVLTASGGITGSFASLVQPLGMPPGVSFEAVYTPGAVAVRAIVAACYANCDGSTVTPVLNVNDFICFQQKFAAADPYANCDGSTAAPVLNVNDFICFIGRYAAGCP